nr:hypothetical protein [Tanacetum cinerariifolium]
MQEVILLYNGLGIPTRQILDSRGVIPSKTTADAKVAIQEMAEDSQKWHNGTSRSRSTKTSNRLAAIQAQLYNLGREIKKVNEKVYAAQVGCEQCKGPHYTKDCPLKDKGKPSKKLTIPNPRDQVKSISTTAKADSYPIRRIGSFQYVVSTGQNRTLMDHMDHNSWKLTLKLHISIIPYPERRKTQRVSLYLINNACFNNALVDLGASVSVMPLLTYLNLRLVELADSKLTVELADKTVKYPKGIAENVLVGIGKFVFPVDFIILDMPEDIKVTLILGRPFLSTAHAKIDVFKRKITLRVGEERIIFKSIKPAISLIKRVYMLSLRERMELDLEARLMGDTLEGKVIKEFRTWDDELDTGIDDYPSYYGHDKKIHIDYFAVLEDMDACRDEGIGDVIFGELFLREVGINARRFDGMITIYNGNDEVTYQMVQSHPRFKHHTNEQCNKIPPLLKVSDEDKMNEISHSYQKLKGFYKAVLNLGPEYIRDVKTKEWLTREQISVHEME